MERRTISKAELETIYRENSNNKAIEILGISLGTLYRLIDRAGIARKDPGRKLPKEPVVFTITE